MHYLIFAWNDNDPITGDNDWLYHGKNRIEKSTVLLQYRNETLAEQNTLPSDTFTYVLQLSNVSACSHENFIPSE